MNKTKVAILGTGFIATIHSESYKRFVNDAEVVAVFGRNKEKAKEFANHHGIASYYDSVETLLANEDVEVVDVCLPNYQHYYATMLALNSNKHVIIEKPLAMNLEEADEMILLAQNKNLKLMYAEELCFAPKYERVRLLVEAGAVGEVYMLKQAEKHSGPHSEWFYKSETAGGGVMMDMGCHALAWFRWMTNNSPVKSVYADMKTVLHNEISDCEDNTITIVEFENGVTAVAEDSWAKHGGMDDRIEVYGTKGVSYADLFRGNAALTYSKEGYDYAMEKAGNTEGWTFTVYEEAFNQGYPQELMHFIDCVRNNKKPLVTGEDGRAVLEIINAAYASAKRGVKIEFPFNETAKKPIDFLLK